mgnify:CR=1 FL=1
MESTRSVSIRPRQRRAAAQGEAIRAEFAASDGDRDNMPPEPGIDRQFATNLARGLQVLRAFTPAEPMLGNRELVDRTGLPKATVSRLTYTLTFLGYLVRVDRFQKYRLGAGVLTLGYPLLASLRVRQLARPAMERIAAETGCTVNLGMRDGLSVVFVDTFRIDRSNLYQPDIGSTRPLLSTSVGRALVLVMPPQQRLALLNRQKVADPAGFERDHTRLEVDEKNLRERGFCHSRGDWRREIHGVSVPIRRHEEGFALNCTMSTFRLRERFLEDEVAPRLIETVHEIELALGLP